MSETENLRRELECMTQLRNGERAKCESYDDENRYIRKQLHAALEAIVELRAEAILLERGPNRCVASIPVESWDRFNAWALKVSETATVPDWVGPDVSTEVRIVEEAHRLMERLHAERVSYLGGLLTDDEYSAKFCRTDDPIKWLFDYASDETTTGALIPRWLVLRLVESIKSMQRSRVRMEYDVQVGGDLWIHELGPFETVEDARAAMQDACDADIRNCGKPAKRRIVSISVEVVE